MYNITMAANTEKRGSMFGACYSYLIKISKVVKINLPATGNTHPLCLKPWKILAVIGKHCFYLLSGMCDRDGFEPKRKKVSSLM